jgi:hypothetical protein
VCFLLLAATVLCAQGIPAGRVTQSVILPERGTWSIDFSLISDVGADQSQGFAYNHPKHNGPFVLWYTGNYICLRTCSFVGNITSWSKQPAQVGSGCTLYNAALSGTFAEGNLVRPATGVYFQAFCDDGILHVGAGGVTLYVTQ